MFKKGQSGNPKGKPVGSKNRSTTEVKNAFIEVFHKRGGVNALLKFSNENPVEFYKILGKMVPKEMDLKVEGDITIKWEQ